VPDFTQLMQEASTSKPWSWSDSNTANLETLGSIAVIYNSNKNMNTTEKEKQHTNE